MDFFYHRSLAPMLWAFVAIASVELVIGHLLVMLWRPWVAIALSAITVIGIAWFVFLIRSFRRLPVRIDDGVLTLRAGRLKSVAIPLDRIKGLRGSWTAADLKRRDTINLALLAWPNVVVDVDPPLASGRRQIAAVAHKLDDVAAFTTAIGTLGPRNG